MPESYAYRRCVLLIIILYQFQHKTINTHTHTHNQPTRFEQLLCTRLCEFSNFILITNSQGKASVLWSATIESKNRAKTTANC